MRTLAPLVGLLALAAVSSAQTTLTRSNGVLGSTLDYAVQGDPSEIYVFMPSLLPGPTPVAFINPGDPRLLSVGLDQSALWQIGLLDPSGIGNISLPLPPDPGLQGVAVYGQLITITLGPLMIDDVSNPTAVTLSETTKSHNTIGNMLRDSTGHSSTVLDDGSVLIAGGSETIALVSAISNGIERFDPQLQAFVATGQTLATARAAHTATKLADGRVLFLGGLDNLNNVLLSAEIYDPVANTVTPAAGMSAARTQHTATLLTDGRVLVTGGTSDFDFNDPLAALGAIHRSTALYNPMTNSWVNGPNLPGPRILHSATLLANGRVLVTGGITVTVFIFPIPSFTSQCSLFDPMSNLFLSAASFNTPRAAHTQTLLSNGQVLLVGGTDGDLLSQVFTPLASCRLYTPGTNSWANVASMGSARALPSGLFQVGSRVHVMGGFSTFDIATQSGTPVLDVESSGLPVAWTIDGQIGSPRPAASSVPVDGGQRILTTGAGAAGDTSAEMYLP